MSSREEIFKKAVQKHKQEQEEQAKKKTWEYSYENIVYSALSTEKPSVIRIIGLPISERNNDKYSPKLIYMSMIRGDNDKLFRCIWPDRNQQPDWILWKIISKVLDYEWDNTTSNKIFKYANSHPSIFNRVYKNGRPQNTYEKGWMPFSTVLMNVIDRSMTDWHKENKHTVLLSKKMNTYTNASGESVASFTPGVPRMLYDLIMNDVVEYYGDWETYDIVISKLVKSPYYKVDYLLKHSEEYSPDIVKLAVEGELTPEERQYEKYDLDKLFKITSYTKIYNRLKSTIMQIDSAFKTNYLDELVELMKEEKDRWENEDPDPDFKKDFENYTSNNLETSSNKFFTNSIPDEEVEKIKQQIGGNITIENQESTPPITNSTRRVVRETKEEKEMDNSSLLIMLKEKGFLGIDKLTDEEKQIITGFTDDGRIIYNTKELLYHCNHCDFESPGDFHVCPKCGSLFA